MSFRWRSSFSEGPCQVLLGARRVPFRSPASAPFREDLDQEVALSADADELFRTIEIVDPLGRLLGAAGSPAIDQGLALHAPAYARVGNSLRHLACFVQIGAQRFLVRPQVGQ